jgi:predicted dehydrogenase
VKPLEKIKLFFIGGGVNSAIGRTHLIASQMDSKFEVVGGLFSRNREINKRSHQVFGIGLDLQEYKFEQIPDLFNSGLVNCVLLATPTNLHFDSLKFLLEHKIPVIVEKAAVIDSNQGLEIYKLINKYQGFNAVTYNYTGYPMVRLMKQLITSGKIGEIIHFKVEMPQDSYLRVNKISKKVRLPQAWRQVDYQIPTIFLDLASHCIHLSQFTMGIDIESVFSTYNHYANVKKVIDHGEILLKTKEKVTGSVTISKSSLGQRNGLNIRIYGTLGSLSWVQEHPNQLWISDKYSETSLISFGSNYSIINEDRYTRFKAGHPAGFIEAFANLYWDISLGLNHYLKIGSSRGFQNDYIPSLEDAILGINLLKAAVDSNKKGKWVKVAT